MIASGSAWSHEPELWSVLDHLLNQPFGLFLIRDRCSIQEVIPPPALAERLETSAQRQIAADTLHKLPAGDYNALLRGEAIEAMRSMTSGSPYVSVPDLTDPAHPLPTAPQTPQGLPAPKVPGGPPGGPPGAPASPGASGNAATTPPQTPEAPPQTPEPPEPTPDKRARPPRSMLDE